MVTSRRPRTARSTLTAGLSAGLALAACSSAPAWSSSPAAWEAYGQQVQQACLKASTLRRPMPAGERLDLPAAGGGLLSALMLQGSYPQPHMAKRRGLELCVYDAGRKQASVGDAQRLLQLPGQPSH